MNKALLGIGLLGIVIGGSTPAAAVFGVGTHRFLVHPVLHPEKAQEITFEIGPGGRVLDHGDTLEVSLHLDPATAPTLAMESLRIFEVNGQALAEPILPQGVREEQNTRPDTDS